MKYALIALLLVFSPVATFAQRNNLYVDAGISLARLYPGTSTTYNYNLARYLGLGIGFQAYDFHATMTNFQLVPAVYGEVRFNIRSKKRDKFFSFLDLGVDFYKHNGDYWREGNFYYKVRDDNGSYLGLGFGYLRRPKKPGWEHYFSLKLISNSYKVDAYNLTSGAQSTQGLGRATLVASFGFKF